MQSLFIKYHDNSIYISIYITFQFQFQFHYHSFYFTIWLIDIGRYVPRSLYQSIRTTYAFLYRNKIRRAQLFLLDYTSEKAFLIALLLLLNLLLIWCFFSYLPIHKWMSSIQKKLSSIHFINIQCICGKK